MSLHGGREWDFSTNFFTSSKLYQNGNEIFQKFLAHLILSAVPHNPSFVLLGFSAKRSHVSAVSRKAFLVTIEITIKAGADRGASVAEEGRQRIGVAQSTGLFERRDTEVSETVRQLQVP